MHRRSGVVEGPPAVTDLVGCCIEYAKTATGLSLDLTAETLPILDHYLDLARADGTSSRETLSLLGRVVGAYFGQVLCQTIGGFWRVPSPNIHDWQFCARRAFLSLNPIGVGYDALCKGEEHEGPSSALKLPPEDRSLVQQRLESLPPVTDSDYYLTTTRFEAIEFVVDTLVEGLESQGYGGVEFTEEDYAAEALPHPFV